MYIYIFAYIHIIIFVRMRIFLTIFIFPLKIFYNYNIYTYYICKYNIYIELRFQMATEEELQILYIGFNSLSILT